MGIRAKMQMARGVINSLLMASIFSVKQAERN